MRERGGREEREGGKERGREGEDRETERQKEYNMRKMERWKRKEQAISDKGGDGACGKGYLVLRKRQSKKETQSKSPLILFGMGPTDTSAGFPDSLLTPDVSCSKQSCLSQLTDGDVVNAVGAFLSGCSGCFGDCTQGTDCYWYAALNRSHFVQSFVDGEEQRGKEAVQPSLMGRREMKVTARTSSCDSTADQLTGPTFKECGARELRGEKEGREKWEKEGRSNERRKGGKEGGKKEGREGGREEGRSDERMKGGKEGGRKEEKEGRSDERREGGRKEERKEGAMRRAEGRKECTQTMVSAINLGAFCKPLDKQTMHSTAEEYFQANFKKRMKAPVLKEEGNPEVSEGKGNRCVGRGRPCLAWKNGGLVPEQFGTRWDKAEGSHPSHPNPAAGRNALAKRALTEQLLKWRTRELRMPSPASTSPGPRGAMERGLTPFQSQGMVWGLWWEGLEVEQLTGSGSVALVAVEETGHKQREFHGLWGRKGP
ncbi:Cyclic nucleotide-gated cation channel beta-1, partial [Ophiophagus hannah]